MQIDLSCVQLKVMQMSDLDEVVAVEHQAYTHPWSRLGFEEALIQDYDAWVLRAQDNYLLGYFVQMPVIDDANLLTLVVQPAAQGQGVARILLTHLLQRAQLMGMLSATLEVRVSNQRAIHLYTMAGFVIAGRRKAYYQTASSQREDALIMRLVFI